MTSREEMLTRVRAALGRSANDAVPEPPAVRLRAPEVSTEERVAQFSAALTTLAGNVTVAHNMTEARERMEAIAGRRSTVTPLSGDVTTADVGINRADYALADTGTLVYLSESEETRLISLLPPAHIAIVARDRILSGLDELFTLHPRPAEQSSSMVLITGPSRTADIEMRLVRGVHGPGELHVIVVEDVTHST